MMQRTIMMFITVVMMIGLYSTVAFAGSAPTKADYDRIIGKYLMECSNDTLVMDIYKDKISFDYTNPTKYKIKSVKKLSSSIYKYQVATDGTGNLKTNDVIYLGTTIGNGDYVKKTISFFMTDRDGYEYKCLYEE